MRALALAQSWPEDVRPSISNSEEKKKSRNGYGGKLSRAKVIQTIRNK